MSVEAAVDPEEAFIASLSSCHMLTFLDLARRAGFVVDSYEDEAEGVMEKNAAGKLLDLAGDAPPAHRLCRRQAARRMTTSLACTTPRTRNASSPIRSRPTSTVEGF